MREAAKRSTSFRRNRAKISELLVTLLFCFFISILGAKVLNLIETPPLCPEISFTGGFSGLFNYF